MATEMSTNEMQSFYEFLGRRLEKGAEKLTPEQSVHEFRAYQEELRRLRAKIATSHEQYVRGEARELDVDALMERVRAKFTQEGITD
jgi:hypothetical protein